MHINPQVQFAPLAAVVSAMLFHFPLAFTHHFDASAIHQEMQATLLFLYRDADLQVFLPAGKRTEVGNGSVKSSQAQHAFNHTCGLP